MSSKKPTPPKSKTRAKKSANPNSYIVPIILFAVAILIEALAVISQKDVAVWHFLHNFVQSFFGTCAYLWPVYIGYLAIQLSLDIEQSNKIKRLVISGLLLLFISASIDVFSFPAEGTWEHVTAAYTTEGFFRAGFLGY